MAEPVTIDGEVPTNGNLVLVPADPDALVVDGGDPAAALHVTLKFLGDLDPWDEEARAFIHEVLSVWAANLQPVKATVTKVGPLGDEGAMVLFLDAEGLTEARADLSEAVDQIAKLYGADTTDKYPSYTPHLTVGYNVEAPEGWEGREVLLDVARAQWGPETVDFPLGQARVAATRKKDGDGDGFVDDGLPTMRPAIPGFDVDGKGNPIRPKRPKGGKPQQVPGDVKIKRNRVGNVDSARLRRRRDWLAELVVDNGGRTLATRMDFAMRAAELTAIETELERRGELLRKDRHTITTLPPFPAIPNRRPGGDRVLDHDVDIDDWPSYFRDLTFANGTIAVSVSTQDNRTRAYSFYPHTSVTLNLSRKSTGKPLGSLSFKVKDRRIDEGFGDVHFDHAILDPSVRGEGVGMEAFANAVDVFALLGFRQMTVDAQSGGAWGNPGANYNGGYTWARAGFDWADRAAAQDVGRRLVRESTAIWRNRSLGPIPEGAKALGHRLSRADFDADDFPTPNDVAMLGWTPGATKDWFGKKFLSQPLGEPDNEFFWRGRLTLNEWPPQRTDPLPDDHPMKGRADNPFAETVEGGEVGSTPDRRVRTVEVPESLREWHAKGEPENWNREVPVLPDALLEWAADGANLKGLRRLDDDRLHRQLTTTVNAIIAGREEGLSDEDLVEHHLRLWMNLTQGQDARQALSRAIHDGPTDEERELYGLLHDFFLDYSQQRYPEWGDVVPARRMSTADSPFDANPGFKSSGERPEAPSSGFTSWDAMDYDEPYGRPLESLSVGGHSTNWTGDIPKDQILGRFGDTENEVIVARDAGTLQRLIGEPGSPFDFDAETGEAGGPDRPTPEIDDTFRGVVAQRGSRVDAEQLQDAWRVAVADPDDLDAIRAALPPEALRSWQQTYGADAVQAMRMGKGGVPPLEELVAHNARRLTQSVPLNRDNLGVNGMPSAAEIIEHDPEMAAWLGVTEASRFNNLRVPIGRRPLANLLSDPEPPAEGVRYLRMLRRAAARDVGRKGGSVTLHRTNTQGTESPFDTKGGSGLTSWTSDYATAAKYAKGSADTVSIDIPADRILAYDTYGIMASTGFWDFAGQDSYPLPGREVLVTSPEVIDRLDRGVFPLLPAADGAAAPAAPVAALKRKKDGDGDGFVDDGLPTMRPAIPGFDLDINGDPVRPKQPKAANRKKVYHLTDKARFKLNPKKVPEDNALAIRSRERPGLYVAKERHGVETWVNGYGYLRPFVVELDVPEDALVDERWGNEGFVPAEHFDDVEVSRVIPVDAFARETYNSYGWVEDSLGATFDDGTPIPKVTYPMPGYRYEGPDAREMDEAEVKRLVRGTRAARRVRYDGKEPTANPFAETLDGGETGGAATGNRILDDLVAEVVAGVNDTDRLDAHTTEDFRDGYRSDWKFDPGPVRRRLDVLMGRDTSSIKLDPDMPDDYVDEYGYGNLINISRYNAGDWADAAVLARDLHEATAVSTVPLWRGEGFRPPASLQVGDELDLDARGFSTSEQVARDLYSGGGRGTVFRIEPGASTVVDMEPPGDAYHWLGHEEAEVVVSGRFRVTGVDGDTVTIEQIGRPPAPSPAVQALLDGVDIRWTPIRQRDVIAPNPFSELLVGDNPHPLGRAPSRPTYPGMRPVTTEERADLRVEGRPIPPAWTDVYVAEAPDMAMRARGLDAKGRHQYIYSAEHQARQAAAKYERTKELARRVPALDEALQRDQYDDPAAAATALIRHFGLRVGSDADTKARKKAYGATTLQARHVKQYPETGRTTLSFMGKSGQKITVSTRDPDIFRLMEFWTAGKSGTDRIFDTTDSLVRVYVANRLGDDFTPKDLRTLLANVIALDMVSSMRRPTTQAKFKAARNKVADAVAKALGNTRAVTLSSYIDPTVFAAWEGALPA